MIRRLTQEDLPKIIAIIDSNKTFQRKPMTYNTRNYIVKEAVAELMEEPDTSYYFGDFDAEGDLISWVRFITWGDNTNFTYGIAFTTNTKPLEKVGDTFYSKTLVAIVDVGFKAMEDLGLTVGWMISPKDEGWVGHLRFTENDTIKKWVWQDYEDIAPYKASTDNKISRFVFRAKFATSQKIVRFTRSND